MRGFLRSGPLTGYAETTIFDPPISASVYQGVELFGARGLAGGWWFGDMGWRRELKVDSHVYSGGCADGMWGRVESLQGAGMDFARLETMSRNFYILAGTLVFFALVSAGMAFVPSSFQPGLPANGSLWRTAALVLMLGGLASALAGVLTHLFEQLDRRSEESRRAGRRKRRDERL